MIGTWAIRAATELAWRGRCSAARSPHRRPSSTTAGCRRWSGTSCPWSRRRRGRPTRHDGVAEEADVVGAAADVAELGLPGEELVLAAGEPGVEDRLGCVSRGCGRRARQSAMTRRSDGEVLAPKSVPIEAMSRLMYATAFLSRFVAVRLDPLGRADDAELLGAPGAEEDRAGRALRLLGALRSAKLGPSPSARSCRRVGSAAPKPQASWWQPMMTIWSGWLAPCSVRDHVGGLGMICRSCLTLRRTLQSAPPVRR